MLVVCCVLCCGWYYVLVWGVWCVFLWLLNVGGLLFVLCGCVLFCVRGRSCSFAWLSFWFVVGISVCVLCRVLLIVFYSCTWGLIVVVCCSLLFCVVRWYWKSLLVLSRPLVVVAFLVVEGSLLVFCVFAGTVSCCSVFYDRCFWLLCHGGCALCVVCCSLCMGCCSLCLVCCSLLVVCYVLVVVVNFVWVCLFMLLVVVVCWSCWCCLLWFVGVLVVVRMYWCGLKLLFVRVVCWCWLMLVCLRC